MNKLAQFLHDLLQDLVGFSECFAPNTMHLVLEIFRANLFLATHSETNCSSLLSVAVMSVAVVADVDIVESSAYIDTVSGMSLVKIEKARGLNTYPVQFLILIGFYFIDFHEWTPSVFC